MYIVSSTASDSKNDHYEFDSRLVGMQLLSHLRTGKSAKLPPLNMSHNVSKIGQKTGKDFRGFPPMEVSPAYSAIRRIQCIKLIKKYNL